MTNSIYIVTFDATENRSVPAADLLTQKYYPSANAARAALDTHRVNEYERDLGEPVTPLEWYLAPFAEGEIRAAEEPHEDYLVWRIIEVRPA